MYSRRIEFRRNAFLHNRGFSSFGILFQDCENCIAEDNLIIDNATGIFMERSDTKNERKLDVQNADQRGDLLSVKAFIDNARGRKTPLNNAESGRISTLTAMLGRKSIYERRVVNWAGVGAAMRGP